MSFYNSRRVPVPARSCRSRNLNDNARAIPDFKAVEALSFAGCEKIDSSVDRLPVRQSRQFLETSNMASFHEIARSQQNLRRTGSGRALRSARGKTEEGEFVTKRTNKAD